MKRLLTHALKFLFKFGHVLAICDSEIVIRIGTLFNIIWWIGSANGMMFLINYIWVYSKVLPFEPKYQQQVVATSCNTCRKGLKGVVQIYFRREDFIWMQGWK